MLISPSKYIHKPEIFHTVLTMSEYTNSCSTSTVQGLKIPTNQQQYVYLYLRKSVLVLNTAVSFILLFFIFVIYCDRGKGIRGAGGGVVWATQKTFWGDLLTA